MMYLFCHLAFSRITTTKLPEKALLHRPQSCWISLILAGAPERLGTLFLKGHRTLDLGQGEMVALECSM